VWSAQNASWYVGDSKCDIVSVDIYDEGNTSGNVNSLLFLQSIAKNKPVAISECGNFPSVQSIADEKAMWSYIAQWGGNFLMNDDATLSERYNTKQELQIMYNNNLTVTRDKLPDAKKRLEDYKKAQEEKKKAAAATTKVTTKATAATAKPNA
jgi:mannan endo-1,4-beta-mannosidase